jgi:hypothetical protein
LKILFDTNTPAPLAESLRGHENGALLDAAEQAGFEVLITGDQNVRFQEDFTDRKLACDFVDESLAYSEAGGHADRVRRGLHAARSSQERRCGHPFVA